jgi:polysaccharide biosynthesis protein PslG
MRVALRIVGWLVLLAAATAQAPSPSRALPLHRFVVSQATQTDAHGYFRPALAVGDDYFDGHDTRQRVHRHMQEMKELRVRFLRCAFSWNGIEPEQGQFDFAFWDMLVDEAERAGVQIIPYVAYTPKWAAKSEENFWQQAPRSPAMFANVMRTLAARYRGRIKSWELWNEPDLTDYWRGSSADLSELVKAGAQAVREGDPEAVVVLSGISREPSDFFHELLYTYHLDRWVDVLALHAYPESWGEERAEDLFPQWIPQAKSYVKNSGDPVDLWLDEMGYADYRYDAAHASAYNINIYYRYEHSPRYAADFLLKSFVLALASNDLSLVGWYRIDDFRHSDPRMPGDKVNHHLGLIGVDGKPKPAFYAMKFLDQLIDRPIRVLPARVSARAGSQAVIRLFARDDGEVIAAGWLRSSEYSEVVRHTGMERDLRRERVRVTLPCSADHVATYNALGKRLASAPAAAAQVGMELRGDQVTIVTGRCPAAP